MGKTFESLIDDEKMEKGLLVDERGAKREGLGINSTLELDEFIEEAKRIGYIAGPIVAVNFSQYFLQVISVMMVGHLGQLSLSSIAIAISFCGVTGFSLLFGMSSALETYVDKLMELSRLYMMFSDTCTKTLVPITMDVFQGIREFFRFAIPSAFMICTRVSNELRAGNPHSARIAVFTALSIAVLESITFSTILFSTWHVFGYVFSNEKEVVDYVANMAPLLCVSVILNILQVVLSGIARESGWQDSGAYINLAAYNLCGVPVAVILGFWVQMRGKGLRIGIQAGDFLQTVLLSVITSCVDWHKQARKARDRLLESDVQTQVHSRLMSANEF
ncbi:hypothetical protein CRYUN_Cryun21dG0089600 [Craigia yunnanensis]